MGKVPPKNGFGSTNAGAAVEIVNADAQTPLLIICDHASNRVPEALNNLGLDADVLARHIGWDIGAAAVARRLARALDATAILAGTSRLVIDPNRDPADPTSIPAISDRVRIPANCDLSAEERAQRRADYFQPYHDAIEREIARLRAHCTAPAIFSVHSFTPEMPGEERPWHIGVLWNKDPRMAGSMIQFLRAHADQLVVGDNQPYRSTAMAAATACPIVPSKSARIWLPTMPAPTVGPPSSNPPCAPFWRAPDYIAFVIIEPTIEQ